MKLARLIVQSKLLIVWKAQGRQEGSVESVLYCLAVYPDVLFFLQKQSATGSIGWTISPILVGPEQMTNSVMIKHDTVVILARQAYLITVSPASRESSMRGSCGVVGTREFKVRTITVVVDDRDTAGLAERCN